jgi:predicted RNase H-like HicB family nuclease
MPRTARSARSPRPRPISRRLLKLTAVYTPCPEGGFAAEILEADTVVSQGETLDEARDNLAEALGLMLDEAPHQVGSRPPGHEAPPYTVMEQLFVLVPA